MLTEESGDQAWVEILANTPVDEEPLDDEDLAAIEEAQRDIIMCRGKYCNQLKKDLGNGGKQMANKTGPQPDIKYCPICKGDLHNIPRAEMKSKCYVRKDGTVSEHTHTYECLTCFKRFEINQDR